MYIIISLYANEIRINICTLKILEKVINEGFVFTNYDVSFDCPINKLTFTAVKFTAVKNKDENNYCISELRLFGSTVNNSGEKNPLNSIVTRMPETNPDLMIIDNSDPETDNPDAYCDPMDFESCNAGGYNGNYLRYNGYDSVYGHKCVYHFVVNTYPEGCRYALSAQWPLPCDNEQFVDLFEIQVYNWGSYTVSVIDPSEYAGTWYPVGEFWENPYPPTEDYENEYTVNFLHYTYNPQNTYTFADAVMFEKKPNKPYPPEITNVIVSGDDVYLTYKRAAWGVQGCMIERGESTASFQEIAVVEGERLEKYTDYNLPPATYYYRIRFFTSEAISDYSNIVSVSTIYSSNGPGNLIITTLSSSELELTWADYSDTEESFVIERRQQLSDYTVAGSVAANITTYIDNELMPDTTYYYRVGGIANETVFGYSYEKAGQTAATPEPTDPPPTPEPTPEPTPTPEPQPGDVNRDGIVDIVDALLIAQYYVDLPVSLFFIEDADVNMDGMLDIVDALLVAQFYIELITEFPVNTPTLAPTPEGPDITEVNAKVQYKCGETNPYSTVIKPQFNIVNTGTTAIPLGALTCKYYYTDDEKDVTNTINIVSSLIETTYITATFHGQWLKLSFAPGAGLLEPGGETGPIEITINKTTREVFNQYNDYSFDPTKTFLTDWDRITLYYNDELVRGTEIPRIDSISYDIEFPVNSGYTDHWIPNTGDPLIFSSIKIKGVLPDNSEIPLPEPLNSIIIRPPVDLKYVGVDKENANIINNKGTCKYELYVVYSENDEVTLVTFNMDNEIATSYFQIHYNDIFFYNITGSPLYGMVKIEDGYFLGTRTTGENTSSLYFRDNNRPEGQQESEDIRIRVVMDDDKTIRPGDDMKLRFGISGLPEFDQLVPEGDFLAVYDKILHERAKAFCNNPAIGDWTNFNTDAVICDAVAYSHGCADSIEHFNADLTCQQAAITSYYSNNNSIWTPENPNPHENWSPWNFTYSPPDEPTSEWSNYLCGTYNTDTTHYDSLVITINEQGETQTFYPFTPGFATWRKDNGGYRGIDTGYSAGVDCGGFIQRVADYENNPYVLESCDDPAAPVNEHGRLQWGNTTPNLRGPYAAGLAGSTYSWEINNINLLVPGDILIDVGTHVVMVLGIEYEEGTRKVVAKAGNQRFGILVIEATRGEEQQWRVIDTNSWDELPDSTDYNMYRLRTSD